MKTKIHVAILDDFQSVIDGYLYRLEKSPDIEIVGVALNAEDLKPILEKKRVDVLLLDVHVPVSSENKNPYPIQHLVQALLKRNPNLRILIISALEDRALIDVLIKLGIAGYLFKRDQTSIQQLASIVMQVAAGGKSFSGGAFTHGPEQLPAGLLEPLSLTELRVLSICAAYPEKTEAQIALELGVAPATVRNQLASCYRKLDVHGRLAAVTKAQSLGLLSKPKKPEDPI